MNPREDRLTVALHIQRKDVLPLAGDPLGFSVDLSDPQDIRRGERAWEQLAFVVDHVLEEALVKLGITACQRCQGTGRYWFAWTTAGGGQEGEYVPCEVCTRARIKDTFRGMEGQ